MPDAEVMRDRARRLRREMTPAERFLWKKLRKRRLGGFRFRRQVPLGRYILDFACFEPRVVVEMDGGQHDEQRDYDAARTAWLESQGFAVVRFWNHQLSREWDTVEEAILRRLRSPVEVPADAIGLHDSDGDEAEED